MMLLGILPAAAAATFGHRLRRALMTLRRSIIARVLRGAKEVRHA